MDCRCVKCGYRWRARVKGKPKECPDCKSRRWEKVRTEASDAKKAG